MPTHTMKCCDLCETPIETLRDGLRVEKRFQRKEGVVITLGFSRGGWGQRQDWADFRGEVCGPCFDEIGKLLEPAVEFVKAKGARRIDGDWR